MSRVFRVFKPLAVAIAVAGAVVGSTVEPGWSQPPDPEAMAQAQVQTPAYSVTGTMEWLVRYGLGDARLLAGRGYSRGLFFSQNLTLDANVRVRVERPVPGTLALLAQIDNSQPEFLQSLSIRWLADRWSAEFGDFPMGRPESPFAASDRLLKGFKVQWRPDDALTLSATLSQVSGIKQTRVFKGNLVEETVRFAFKRPDRPWAKLPYRCEAQDAETLCNLNGLDYFPLGTDYVEGFTKVKLRFETGDPLRQLLEGYELGFLYAVIKGEPERELDPSAYTVVFTGEGYVLLLNAEFFDLLRDRVLDDLDEYNVERVLSGEELREYPFSPGTDYERGFLERLSRWVTIAVDGRAFRPEDAQNRRFYALPHPDIDEESVRVEVKLEGEWVELPDPRLVGFEVRVYAEPGVLELDFPETFFADESSQVRVRYAYKSTTGTYVLGLSVLKGSEKVYLNGQLLQPGVDYLIEYETGFLVLFKEVGPEDTLRIEYEIARGGLGGFAEYRRSFQGLSAQLKPFEDFTLTVDLLRAYDSPIPGIPPETLATMPNDHWVLGLSGALEGDGLQGAFDLGLGVNRFPPDDNLKAALPNRVYVIKALPLGPGAAAAPALNGEAWVLVGHRNGVTLYSPETGDWSHYGPAEGLAGLDVYDVAIDPLRGRAFFATGGGLSVLRLRLGSGDPRASFARPANWRSLTEQEGLPAGAVRAVLLTEADLWVGTAQGLARLPLDELERFLSAPEPEEERLERLPWVIYQSKDHPGLVSDRVRALAWADGRLYVATDRGLSVLDPQTGRFAIVPELRGLRVHALLSDGSVVYAATERGVRALLGGRGLGWPVADVEVLGLALGPDGELWYGTRDGLYREGYGRVPETQGLFVTAVGAVNGTVWAGVEADPQGYAFPLVRVEPEGAGVQPTVRVKVRVFDQSETRLDGRAQGRFMDVPAAEHTDLGWLGRFTLTKALGPLRLQGTLEGRSWGFTPVGALERQDRLGLTLSATYPLSDAVQLTARHEEGLTDLSSFPSQVLRDGLALSVQLPGGPQLDLDYTLERVDRDFERPGFDRRRRSYGLAAAQELFDGRLTAQLGARLTQLETPRRPAYTAWEGELNGRVRAELGPALNVQLGYRLPLQLRFGELFGLHRLSWGLDWRRDLVVPLPGLGLGPGPGPGTGIAALPLSLQGTFQGSGQLPLGLNGRPALDQSATLLVRSAVLQLGGLVLSPQLTLTARARNPLAPQAVLELGGEGTLQLRWGELDGTLFLKHAALTQAYSRLSRFVDTARLSLSHGEGFWGVRPSLELMGSLETFVHPLLGRKGNGQYQISLGLSWARFDSPLQADLLLSRQVILSDQERTVSYSLQESVRYALGPGVGLTPGLDVFLDYVRGERRGKPVEELSGELGLSMGVTVLEGWSATLTLSYLFQADAYKPSDQVFTQSLALTVRFGRTLTFSF